MAVQLEAVAFEVADAVATASFWAALLDREIVTEVGGALVPGDATQIGLRFVTADSVQVGKPRLHLHVTTASLDDQRSTVETALQAGGRQLDVGQGPDVPFVVLADPAGNELCVIEPGDRYLAGAGRLGEVTCDGTRAVGLFWRDALGWPLVLDEEEQTAVQSPRAGTKIAWESWRVDSPAPPESRRRQRFDLVSSNPAADADRLVALGAERPRAAADGIELADPGGDVFVLRAG